jgi:hypothetical protein
MRLLRDETGAAVCWVHHTGHEGSRQRGTSDLESVWETRLTWKRDGQSPLVELAAEHREAEASDPVSYRIAWDGETRTMRLDADDNRIPSLAERIIDHLHEHGPSSTDDVRAGVNTRRSDVLRTLEQLENAGTVHNGPSGRRDGLGRPIRDKVWKPTDQAGLWPVPETGTDGTTHAPDPVARPAVPPFIKGDGTDGPQRTDHEAWETNGSRAPSSVDEEPDAPGTPRTVRT